MLIIIILIIIIIIIIMCILRIYPSYHKYEYNIISKEYILCTYCKENNRTFSIC